MEPMFFLPKVNPVKLKLNNNKSKVFLKLNSKITFPF